MSPLSMTGAVDSPATAPEGPPASTASEFSGTTGNGESLQK